MKVLETLKNALKVPETRKNILFTLLIVVIYRIGAVIPVPYVSSDILSYIMSSGAGSIFDYLNIMSGEALSRATLFALSVSPYITASIVIQLLTIAIPALERLSKEGEEGRKKLTSLTRYVTVALALITSYGYYMFMRNNGVLTNTGVFAAIVVIACYCAGAALIMWLAEKINDYGFGNGISIILLINIISSFPSILGSLIAMCKTGQAKEIIFAVLTVVITIAAVFFVVFITNSERRIPVQYAKKVVGRKMYGGQGTNLPIKLNMTGVMPIIFASSIVSIPTTIGAFFAKPKPGSFWEKFLNVFSYTSPLYAILFFILIIAFAYFYVSISFNPIEVSNNLKSNGGSVPGIRPGKPTSDYITRILNRITLIGALFLGIIAVFPLVINMATGGGMSGLAFGGSSLLIIVGVIIESAQDLEAKLTLRHYKGFLE